MLKQVYCLEDPALSPRFRAAFLRVNFGAAAGRGAPRDAFFFAINKTSVGISSCMAVLHSLSGSPVAPIRVCARRFWHPPARRSVWC
jgi:hypothetical protein